MTEGLLLLAVAHAMAHLGGAISHPITDHLGHHLNSHLHLLLNTHLHLLYRRCVGRAIGH